MGGMCAREFLTRYRRDGMRYGQVILVLDSAPSASTRTRRPGLAYSFASWYRGGPLSTALSAMVRRFGRQPTPEPDSDAQLIRDAHHAGEWTGMPTLTSRRRSWPRLRRCATQNLLTSLRERRTCGGTDRRGSRGDDG